MHRFHGSQSKKNYLKKKLGNCCKFRKFAKWHQTSPIMCQFVKEYKKKSSLPNLQIFEIRKIVPKIAKCMNLSRNTKKIRAWQIIKFYKFAKYSRKLPNAPIRGEMQKNPSLRNFTIFEICKIISQFAKCADLWRNITKKSKLATRDTSATHSRM